jgi:transcriptional regulator with XRE-family HTH domain
MAPAKLPPTIRQRRLGAELRRLREHADLSATRAGELFGATQSRISNIESGGYAVSAERVRALARLYECNDERLIEALTHLTGGRTRGWWEEYHEILPSHWLDLAELEHHASFLRVGTIIHVPGLLQTPDHARAVMADAVPVMAPYEVEHRVSHRMKRQGILSGADPTPLTAIIHEAALRMGFGGVHVARAQLEHLLKRSEEPHIRIAVIPFGARTFSSAGHSIDQFGGEVPELDTVQLDTDYASFFVDASAQLARYRTTLDRLAECALATAASQDLMRRVMRDL